jgi:hypothetical protein
MRISAKFLEVLYVLYVLTVVGWLAVVCCPVVYYGIGRESLILSSLFFPGTMLVVPWSLSFFKGRWLPVVVICGGIGIGRVLSALVVGAYKEERVHG